MFSQKTAYIILSLLVIGVVYYFLSSPTKKAQQVDITTIVEKGEFKIYVTATGELEAKHSVKIQGPQGMRAARIYQTNITNMVPEGTIVAEGEYVATLDKTELDTKIKEARAEYEKIETQLQQAKIDTAIELRGLRDQLINLKFSIEEKKLEVEQSKYEPQMVIRQAEINKEKEIRDYSQLIKKYELTQAKSDAKVSEIMASLRQEQLKLDRFSDLAQQFTIKAPKDGMVIYARNWNGKIGPGSQISSWNPTVAELPDLTDMVSKTFVNEVDISSVKKGQDVAINIDAFPDMSFTGKVLKVANIGEQLRGYDSKVFEVKIQLYEADSVLRPAMTTSNEILAHTYTNVLSIPLEALHTDSLPFVIKSINKKLAKHEVITGENNNNNIIIAHGLENGDEILLTSPDNLDELAFVALPKELKNEIAQKQKEEEKKRKEEARKRAAQVKDENLTNDQSGNSNIIIFN